MLIVSIDKKHKSKKVGILIAFVVAISGLGGYLLYSSLHKNPVVTTDKVATSNGVAGGKLTLNGNESQSTGKSLQAKADETVQFTSSEVPIDTKANAAVMSWKQSGDNGVNIEARTKNGDKWTDWTKVEAEEPGKDGVELTDSKALVLANRIDDIQYRITLNGSGSAPSSTVDLTNSSITTIDSSQGPSEKVSFIDKLFPKANASVNFPQTITREQWGSPEPNWSSWPPQYAKLGRVILHHTASTESNDSYADVRAIWHYHARTLDWGDIGYHYIVDSKGQIFEGRYYDKDYARRNKVEVIGGHAYGNNVGTIGISTIGNYTYQQPTTASMNSVARMIGYKLAPYGIDPSGNGPYGLAVVGHRDVYPTTCPGNNFVNHFGYIKTMASADYRAYVPFFGFDPMSPSRWMRLSKNTRKVNLDTGSQVDGTLSSGTDIKYMDKYKRDGKWYLRTQHDYDSGIRKGIPLSDITDIQPEVLNEPVWLQLTSERRKWNPVTEYIDYSVAFPSGLITQFSERVRIKSQWHYKTAYDYRNGNSLYIRGSALESPSFRPFTAPRYMTVNESTDKVNPLTGQSEGKLNASTQYLFTSKMTVRGITYYQTDADNKSSTMQAIPSSSVSELNFIPLETPIWKSLATPQPKLSSLSLEPTPGIYSPSEYPAIKFQDYVSINGNTYYRSAYDSRNGTGLVMPISGLSDVTFSDMSIPRLLTNTQDVDILDPSTGQKIGTLPKDTSRFYDTKISLGGVVYLRSKEDTESKAFRVVKLDYLR